MTTVLPMQCFACARLHPDADPSTGTRLAAVCDAFPAGIPFVMATGGDHRQPLPDDHGLRFLHAEGVDAEQAFAMWERTFSS